MKYTVKRENNPALKNYGRYKAVAVHPQTVTSEQIEEEIQAQCSAKASDVKLVLYELREVLLRHLQQGHRVRLKPLGMLKLEIESERVDSPDDFNADRDIRGVRLHFLPESTHGTQPLYSGIHFERQKD